MKKLLAFLFILCSVSGCVSKGYVPHYILTDSPESKAEVEQFGKRDRVNPNNSEL